MAAANRTESSLGIALIVFVMLTFILAVTTYLFFKQKMDEQTRADAATKELETTKAKLNDELAQKQRIRDVLGTEKETADDVEAERNDDFQKRFAGFQEDPKSYKRLIAWLEEAVQAKDNQLKTLQDKNADLEATNTRQLAEATDQVNAYKKATDDANQERETESKRSSDRWDEHTKKLDEVTAAQQAALEASEKTQAILDELAKLGPQLSPALRQKFTAPPEEGADEPWPDRVRYVLQELDQREKTIQELNATLAKLRVADKNLQRTVNSAIPADERIDGFDGHIIAIRESDRSALLSFTSTNGLRPGLLFRVYDPDEPRPQIGTAKGVLEIVEVEGDKLARARIREDDFRAPLLAGDGVATSFWSPGETPQIVVVGYIQLDGDLKQDADALASFIGRAGGAIEESVSPRTTLVVDGGVPAGIDVTTGRIQDWRPVDVTRRQKALDRAKELGIRVVALDPFLTILGLDRESLVDNALPGAVGRSAPTRTGSVAY